MPDHRTIEELGHVNFKGHPRDGKNLNAAGIVGDLLVVASDENDRLQILRRQGDHHELLSGREILLNDSGQEAEVEGLASEGDAVYALDSHPRRRPKPKAGANREANRTRIETVEPPFPFRSVLVRFRLADDGSHSGLTATTLRSMIAGNRILQPLTQIPCKENGVDVEGLAVHGGQLRAGFRGPVLQHGFVPVITCFFANPVASAETQFVNLGGRGIRDIERVASGFLFLAGPVSDVPVSFQLYGWDGEDCAPGAGTAAGHLRLLGDVLTRAGAKAKGSAIEKEADGHYTALVLFDGLKEGGVMRLRIVKDSDR